MSVPWPFPENGAHDFIENVILPNQGRDRWFWGVYLVENPTELIGSIDLWRKPKPENRGFWLSRKYWSRGIMTEAVLPITDYAFSDLNFKTLFFANAKGNTQSRRVKEKTGATLLRTEPASFVDPKFTEHEIWELKRENWEKIQKNSKT